VTSRVRHSFKYPLGMICLSKSCLQGYFRYSQGLVRLSNPPAPSILTTSEAALRDAINKSTYCKLRTGCSVLSRENLENRIIVHYKENETERQIKTQWLIGADGKTGVVRKKFLEPTADVQQVTGLYEYTGTVSNSRPLFIWSSFTFSFILCTPIYSIHFSKRK